MTTRVGPSCVDDVTTNSPGVGKFAGSCGSPENSSARQSIFVSPPAPTVSVSAALSPPPQPAATNATAIANTSAIIFGAAVIWQHRKGFAGHARDSYRVLIGPSGAFQPLRVTLNSS